MNRLPATVFLQRRIKHIHFVGIGGAGMCGIAEVFANQGYTVSGSDQHSTPVTQKLQGLGITVHLGHAACHIEQADVLVTSTAVKTDNPEVVAARQAHIPIVPRAQMLGELMRFKAGIAVAGTHGKTTTTSILASILSEDDFDPTFVIGGLLNSAGTNARLGSGSYLVAEADESDASFLYLQPMLAIVTNIDADHLETYGGDFEKLRQTFVRFLENLPFYGLAVVCIDDPVIRRTLPDIARPVLTYGFSIDADVHVKADSVCFDGLYSHFEVVRRGAAALSLQLKLPGRHNILNAAAAIGVATEIGVSDVAIQRALLHFGGVGRRVEHLGFLTLPDPRRVMVIDDYGHHPREVEVTLEALRAAYPNQRVVMVFQPHRYSRTRDLFHEFSQVLQKVDRLYLLDVYSAGETWIEGADSASLCQTIPAAQTIAQHAADVLALLQAELRDNDILLFQGAGSVSHFAKEVLSCAKLPIQLGSLLTKIGHEVGGVELAVERDKTSTAT